MTLITLFSRPLIVQYRASKLSQATLFTIISWVINIVYPWMIVYQSSGLWRKGDYFWEKPEINFNHDIIMLVKLKNSSIPSDQIIWSSFSQINSNLDQRLIRIPFITNYETKNGHNGKLDKLNMRLIVPLEEKEEVSVVQLIIFFDYKLEDNCKLRMNSPIILESSTDRQSSRLFISGDIKFNQKAPLPHDQLILLRESFLDNIDNRVYNNELNLKSLLEEHQVDIFSTSTGPNTLFQWTDGRDYNQDEFIIDLRINYTDDLFHFTPSFWYTMKWAWIQYLSIYVVFHWIIQKIRLLVFTNQLTSSVVINESASVLHK